MKHDIAEGEALAIQTFGTSNPGPGCTFISPDGTFVNIYPKLKTHEDLCEWVGEQLDIELEYSDEEFFVREFNWVRLRSDPNMSIIMLPKDSLFRNQWYSLEDWLSYIEERYPNGCRLYLETCDGPDTDVEYKFGTEYFAEDIIKICRRYYSSGKLYMSTEVNKMKKQIKASRLNFDFFDWYNNILTDKQQRDVDDTADELGYPEYDECSDNQLSKIFYRWAKTRYNSNERSRRFMQRELVEASADPMHTYIVKIWHEVEANPESMYLPEASEEIFEIQAFSEEAAIEEAEAEWDGPIDRIEVIDIDPEPDKYQYEDLPFSAGTKITASTIKRNKKIQKGMHWFKDWHDFTIQSVASNGKTCKVTEEWVNEDTGKNMKRTYNYVIAEDNGVEYTYDPKYEHYIHGYNGDLFKLYADGALNYPLSDSTNEAKEDKDQSKPMRSNWSPDTDPLYESHDDEWMPRVGRYDDDDEYTPSATRGDYSPSSPWGAPGMSIRDFI